MRFPYQCYTCHQIIRNEEEERQHIRDHRSEFFGVKPS